MTVPNFLVIGAAKSGTTSLYHYLKQHPQVYVSPIKETNFFAYEERPDLRAEGAHGRARFPVKTMEEYTALFAAVTDQRAIGDVSPLYLESPVAAERISEHIPDAKLLAILRNPIERAYSGYLMHVRDGGERRSFDEAFRDPEREHWVRASFYYEPLRRYYERFRADQIRIWLFDDFRQDNIRAVRDMFRFLDVDETFEPEVETHYNPGRGVLKAHRMYAVLKNPKVMNVADRFVPASLRVTARNVKAKLLNAMFADAPPLPSHLRAKLRDIFLDDIRRLESLIQRDLSHWLSGETVRAGQR